MLDKTNMAAMLLADAPTPPAGVRSYTLTVDTAVDDTDYVFVLEVGDANVTYTINSGAGATTSSIAAAIRDALDNDTNNDGAGVMVDFITEGGGAGATAVIEGLVPGDFFVATESDANLSLSVASDVVDTTGAEAATNAIVGGALAVALVADQNNYDPFTPASPETLLVLTPDASPRNITGLVSYHRFLHIVNASATHTVQLAHESGSSSAANQFSLVGGTSYVIPPRGAVVAIYDDVNSKWHLVT